MKLGGFFKKENSEIWSDKAYNLFNKGNYEKSLKCCIKAIELDPKNAKAWNNKGTCLGSMDQNEEAIVCFKEALKLDPKYPDA